LNNSLYNTDFQSIRRDIMKSVFHLAFNVTDLNLAREFYGGILECKEGRSTKTWVDFDFFDHQISLHLGTPFEVKTTGLVENHKVPMPHLGAVLDLNTWTLLAEKLELRPIEFVLKPFLRFKGKKGEQYSMFFYDPFGNPIEIKSYKNFDEVFNHE